MSHLKLLFKVEKKVSTLLKKGVIFFYIVFKNYKSL